MRELDFLKVVSSELDVCSYLPQQTARLPLHLPVGPVTAEQFDLMLACGFRRSGWFFYRTQCPYCSACEPLRIDSATFRPSRSQRRVQQLGDRQLRTEMAAPSVDPRRLEIFNRHRHERGLNQGDAAADESDYRSFLINSHVRAEELSLWLDDKLIGVSITDIGRTSLSAAYCCFDPDYAKYSLGTYAILQQLAWARREGFQWLYLGLMVSENRHLSYKTNFRPHQRLIEGSWRSFD